MIGARHRRDVAVRLWSIGSIDDAIWSSMTAVLGDSDYALVERMRRPVDRRRRLVTRALLRLAVADWAEVDPTDVVIAAEAGGRPVVTVPTGAALHVSVSHTDDCSLVAVGANPVGVDVEPRIRHLERDVAARICSPAERVVVSGLDDVDARLTLVRTWVRKEAVLKLDGRALGVEPTAVDVRRSHVRLPAGGRWRSARLREVDAGPGHLAAVAWIGLGRAPRSAQTWKVTANAQTAR